MRTVGRQAAALLLPLVIALAACGEDAPVALDDPSARFVQIIADFDLEPLPPIPYPANNMFNAERIALGQLLFFDPILGGESAPWVKQAAQKDPYRFRGNDMACATCHFPDLGFGDQRRLFAGVGGAQFSRTDLGRQREVPGVSIVTGNPIGTGARNSPTILNTAFNGQNSITPTAESFQFVDGRVTTGLEAQAILPITDRDEMAGDAYTDGQTSTGQDSVRNRIRAIPEYVDRFRQAFTGEVAAGGDIGIDHIGRAIAAFEREIITPDSRYDQFVTGAFDAFTDIEKDGFELFFGKGQCGDCHAGPMLSDYTMRVQGIGDGYSPGFGGKNGQGGDFGRFHADPVQFADQKYAFRTLTIRNVEVTGPYFHSGSARTLRETVDFYNRGGQGADDISDAVLAAAGVQRDASIRPLALTPGEIDAILSFMLTTTAGVRPGPSGLDLTAVPQRVPSGLVPPGVPTPDGPGPFTLGSSHLSAVGQSGGN